MMAYPYSPNNRPDFHQGEEFVGIVVHLNDYKISKRISMFIDCQEFIALVSIDKGKAKKDMIAQGSEVIISPEIDGVFMGESLVEDILRKVKKDEKDILRKVLFGYATPSNYIKITKTQKEINLMR